MTVPYSAIGIFVALGAFLSLLLAGVPIWLAVIGYSLSGASAVLVSAWVVNFASDGSGDMDPQQE